MSVINDIEKIIEDAKDDGDYRERNFPVLMSKMNVEMNKVVDSYRVLPEEEKKALHKSISNHMAWSLLAFAENMATYSLRHKEQKLFTNGLSAMGMVMGILDTREMLLIMPLYYDVSLRSNLSFSTILDQRDEFSAFVKAFLDRDEVNKSLKCMGYIFTKDDSNSPIYRRTW